jgi:hypothetical protein
MLNMPMQVRHGGMAAAEMMSMTRSTAAVAGVSTPSVWAGGG